MFKSPLPYLRQVIFRGISRGEKNLNPKKQTNKHIWNIDGIMEKIMEKVHKVILL